MRILGLIPARSGSVGVKGKNTRPLLGKSLIQRAFECARNSGVCDRMVLSTDTDEIRAHAESLGLEAPFLRPSELSDSSSPMLGVIQHALRELGRSGYVPDAVLLLQPTSPLRKPQQIQEAVAALGENDSVCSVIALPLTHCPHYVMKITSEGYLDNFLPEGKLITRRQDVPPAFVRDGTVFLTRVSTLQAGSIYGERCVPLVLDPAESLSIDTEDDWQMAERLLRENSCAH